jgi:hypothetical protein
MKRMNARAGFGRVSGDRAIFHPPPSVVRALVTSMRVVNQALAAIPDELAILTGHIDQMEDAIRGQASGHVLEQVFEIDHVMEGGMRENQVIPLGLDGHEVEVGDPELHR